MTSAAAQTSETLDRSAELPQDWDDLVRGCATAEYTQTAHWLLCARRHYRGARLVVLTVRRGDRLVAGLAAVARRKGPILHLDSSLDGTSGGPLVLDSLDPALRARLFLLLFERFARERRGPLTTLGLALCPAHEQEFGSRVCGLGGWSRREISTAAISLDGGLERVDRERMAKTKRNERNRGLRRGAEVFVTNDPQDLSRFYPLYRKAAAHWGIEPVPEAFMQGLLRGSGLADQVGEAFLTCATLEGEVIGAHLNLHLGDRVLAWAGVTDPALARTHFPSTLCIWGDLSAACERGARWLDLGASEVAGSLLGFKKSFGAELQLRGFYTSRGAALKFAEQVRDRLRKRGEQANRWHDREPERP